MLAYSWEKLSGNAPDGSAIGPAPSRQCICRRNRIEYTYLGGEHAQYSYMIWVRGCSDSTFAVITCIQSRWASVIRPELTRWAFYSYLMRQIWLWPQDPKGYAHDQDRDRGTGTYVWVCMYVHTYVWVINII